MIWIVQTSWKSSSSWAIFCLWVKTRMISYIQSERWGIDSVSHKRGCLHCSLFVCLHHLHCCYCHHCYHYNHLSLPLLFAADVCTSSHRQLVDDGNGNNGERRYDLKLRWSSSMLDEEHKHKVSSTLNILKKLKILSLLVWLMMQEAGQREWHCPHLWHNVIIKQSCHGKGLSLHRHPQWEWRRFLQIHEHFHPSGNWVQ